MSNFRQFCRKFTRQTSNFKQVTLKNAKPKSGSSNEWLTRQLNDPYVEKAKICNYRCRSAFKLLEIDERFKILHPGQTVIDCGASPGSWTQVAVKKVNSDNSQLNADIGTVIAIDKQQIYPVKGATIIGNMDFTSEKCQSKVLEILKNRKVNAVLSDMAPKATGIRSLDQENTIQLCYTAIRFAVRVSKVGGVVLVKLWECGDIKQLQNDISRFYNSVKLVKPNSSRADSAEIFILGRGFKGLRV